MIRNSRPRYFIQTKDDLFFAINTYHHPQDKLIAFLRYIPDENGDRKRDNKKYRKLNSEEAYRFVKKHHPDYLFNWNVDGKQMMGVPLKDIKKIHNPIYCLNKIINNTTNDPYYVKVKKLAKIFHDEAGISYSNMGITGSTILNLQNSETSDIDFIIFGLSNHKKAREVYAKLKYDPESPLMPISGDFWMRVYKKRITDDTLSFDEFKYYEERKNNRGIIDGTLFDILSTMNYEDYEDYPDENHLTYKPLSRMTIECKITDDKQSYDTPSIYQIKEVKTISGIPRNIEKLVSYTHTYAGIVQNNEWVIASGVCEEVTNNKTGEKTYNLTIGTTREAEGEYIKLKKIEKRL